MILKVFVIYWLISAIICLPQLEKGVENILGELNTKVRFIIILCALIFGGLIISDIIFKAITGKSLI